MQGGTPTIREVHGYGKQAAAFGYSRVRGLNAQLAVVSAPVAAPVIARARLRRGNVASHTGAGRLLAQAVATARGAGVGGQVLARADSAYFGHAFVASAQRAGAWFSVTARMNPQIKAAIASIDETAWTAIEYPNAVHDEDERRWVSDAELAETEVTIFTSRRKSEHVTCRLAVRRVRRLNPTDGDGQRELFAMHRHHAFTRQLDPAPGRGRRPAPGPRARRADHRRTRGRTARPPAVGEVRGERRAAGARGDRLQPRPRRRGRRLTPACPRPLGDAAHPPDQHPGPDRVVRPEIDAAPTDPLALGTGVAQLVRHRDRPADSHDQLTTRPTRARPETELESRTDRRTTPARTPSPATIRRKIRSESATVDQGSAVTVRVAATLPPSQGTRTNRRPAVSARCGRNATGRAAPPNPPAARPDPSLRPTC